MSGYVPTLDGWRAVAIGLVIAHHATATVFFPGESPGVSPGLFPHAVAYKLSELGMRGVHVFFAISGFLITARLLQEEAERGRVSLPLFYLRRACRILPLYLLYLGALAALASANVVTVGPWEWWGCLFFFRNYLPDPAATDGWYTRHFWSLSLEEHFYLTWPWLFVLAGKKYRAAVVVMCALAVFGWRTYVNEAQLVSEFGYWPRRTDTRIDGLLWGCFAAMLYCDATGHAWLRRILNPLGWLGVIGLFLIVVGGRFPGSGFLYPFLIPCILVGTAVHPEWLVSRWLEWSVVRWIGRLSYSLYVWQQLFLFGDVTAVRPYPLGAWQELPLNLIATFAVATASYYLVERPITRIGQRMSARATPDSLSLERRM
jgi:peptidoglycan/LPS O-acetylase OafA/YrhL